MLSSMRKRVLGATALCAAAALPFSFLLDMSFPHAFGAALMIESLFILSLAWILYLKGDGVSFFQRPRTRVRGEPEREEGPGWEERIPKLGQAPPLPPAIPGPEGPDSEAYRRLAAAEDALKRRILEGEVERGADRESGGRSGKTGKETALFLGITGVFLLILSLAFQYLPISL